MIWLIDFQSQARGCLFVGNAYFRGGGTYLKGLLISFFSISASR